MTYEVKIAKVTKTFLGVEDHGILTAFLDLEYGGGSGQGAGGYALDTYDAEKECRVATVACGVFVAGILRACGVDAWEKLPGRTVYAIIVDNMVIGLRPLPTEYGAEFMFSELKELK